MSLSRSNSEAVPRPATNPWWPDAFDEVYSASVKEAQQRNMFRSDVPDTKNQQSQPQHVSEISADWNHNIMQNGHSPQIDNFDARHVYHDHARVETQYSQKHATTSYMDGVHPPNHHLPEAFPNDDYQDEQSTHSGFSFKRTLSRSATNASRNELRSHRSAHELGRQKLHRTMTAVSSVTTASSAANSSSTNASSNTQATSSSVMSGYSAGGFSATSAGSLARRKWVRSGSVKSDSRPASAMDVIHPGTSISNYSAHSRNGLAQEVGPHIGCTPIESVLASSNSSNPLKKKKSGFLRKMLDTARTSTATARSAVSTTGSLQSGRSIRRGIPNGVTSISGGTPRSTAAAAEMGLGVRDDWVQMRRDVNRSNSLSRNEKIERVERCQMIGLPVLNPVELLNQADGDEDEYGQPVNEYTDFAACNHALVDKNARFVNTLPALVTSVSLAQGYLCRPYRGNLQRVRAIFTWVAERVAWEEDYDGDIDTRRVIQIRRGCSEEIASLVAEMCAAVGIQAEIVRGYLKPPGDPLRQNLNDIAARPNHWWNTVLVDGEWRVMDCALASPSHPQRSAYSSAGNQAADGWYFLARPSEICYTHVPLLPEQQHIIPPMPHEVLMALPVASPAAFKYKLRMWDFDTSTLQLERLEMAHIHLVVPDDVECVAEVEARSFARDHDGDYFESGER